MNFDELRELRRCITSILERHVQSLDHYHLSEIGGFRNTYLPAERETDQRFSKASTSTCILSITARGLWKGTPWAQHTNALIDSLLDFDQVGSSGLVDRSAFQVSFLLEAALALREQTGKQFTERNQRSVDSAVGYLNRCILRNSTMKPHKEFKESPEDLMYAVTGGANMKGYPPTTFLTQLVLRTLLAARGLTGKTRHATRTWAASQIDHELVLVVAKSKAADIFSLAYAVISFAMVSEMSDLTPTEKQIVTTAINEIFRAQLEDGTWPRSRPLHHDPILGSAYCYEFEMLTQLLSCKSLQDHVTDHLPELEKAFRHLQTSKYQLKHDGLGWASGHHRLLMGPESWSTASAYHFMHLFERVLADEIRKAVFAQLHVSYSPPREVQANPAAFAPKSRFLDAKLYSRGTVHSLRKQLLECFVEKIAEHAADVRRGLPLPKAIAMSMLLFGPPGTSKTRLAKFMADYLGWPLLPISPSHILSDGWDRIHAQAISIFDKIAEVDSTVVFLDEFDELFKARGMREADAVSRFFTTALLPQLGEINERHRVVLLLATNYVDRFDDAIIRRGRFDFLVQVMPPSCEEKLRYWPELKEHLTKQGVALNDEVRASLEAFTFQELCDYHKQIMEAKGVQEVLKVIKQCYEECTLMKSRGDEDASGRTWKETCKEQREVTRIPR
jgi:hypothetical protein